MNATEHHVSRLLVFGFLWWMVAGLGCGSITQTGGLDHDEGGADAAAGMGGEVGDRGRSDASAGGLAGVGGVAGISGDAGGAGAGAGGATCLDANAPGLAYNYTCDGGPPASEGCHAACTLNGTQFVGCTSGGLAYSCYATCAACP